MEFPPVFIGGVKEIVAEFGDVVRAVTAVGAPGTVAGVTGEVATERFDV